MTFFLLELGLVNQRLMSHDRVSAYEFEFNAVVTEFSTPTI